MARAVACVWDHLKQEYGRCSINSWCGGLAFIVSLQVVAFHLATCNADQPPTIAELRRDSAKLRADSIEVQGEFREYRTETVNLAALEKLPSEIGIPLVRSGKVWRSRERFRADFTYYRPDREIAKEAQQSCAYDAGKVYEFSTGPHPDGGMLRVYYKDTAEAVEAMKSDQYRFCQPLDSLWSGDGAIPIVDVLQRPGAKIVPNVSRFLPRGYSILVPASEDNSETQIEFEPTTNHPFGYSFTTAGEDGSLVKVERRVFSIEKEGTMFPSRTVDVVSFGHDKGYTQVVMLDLEPLAADSPIANDFTPASFQNFESGYQVYEFRESGKEKLAERYER